MRVGLVLIWFCVSGVLLQSPDDQLAVEDVQSGLNRLQNNSHVERSELNTDQDSVQADVWAELRELRDMVVEQRVNLQFSQRQIEELKTENAVINNKLQVSTDQVTRLKEENSAINNRLLATQSEVEELKRADSGLEGRVDSAELSVAALREEIANTPKVAFLFASGLNGYYGPFSSDITLVFRKQITNIGNAYSPVTGVFTAPLRGVYYFRFNVLGNSGKYWTGVHLMKNHESVIITHNPPTGSHQYAVGGVTLQLERGDAVYVKLRANCLIYDGNDNHTSFSGFLVFPL